MIPKWLGDNSTVYPSFIGPYVVDAEIVPVKVKSGRGATVLNTRQWQDVTVDKLSLDQFGLAGDDRDILEFIVAFVLSKE